MPSFCRHNRLLQNCPICAREQNVELRAVLSSSAPRSADAGARTGAATGTGSGRRERVQRAGGAAGVTVRRLRHAVDDGYRSPLLPGLKSSDEARRLADELAFAATRLSRLDSEPPGLYAEVADPGQEPEERFWLAFLIAYLYPLEREDPFAAIRQARTTWASGTEPRLDAVETGPRTAYDPASGTRTIDAYRAWAARAGSQSGAFEGDSGWSAERRFARVFERLAFPDMHRGARFELLLTLGVLGVCDLRPATLEVGGADEVTVAAKRAFGIADQLLLGRRADALANATAVPLGCLDLAFYNWESAVRASAGLGPEALPDPTLTSSVYDALGL